MTKHTVERKTAERSSHLPNGVIHSALVAIWEVGNTKWERTRHRTNVRSPHQQIKLVAKDLKSPEFHHIVDRIASEELFG